MPHRCKKLISLILCILFLLEQVGFAQTVSLNLSNYLSQAPKPAVPDTFRPLHLRYLSYDNLNQDFKLLLDKGDTKKEDAENKTYIEENTQTLLKYFFIGLALPNDKFWVNLRPDAPDNIIDDDLAKTDIGRIFLEADVQLKKDTAQFTSPQTPEGKAYWDKLYQKAGELFGTENITIPTLTRPWIVPNEIIIREAPDNAYIYKATLKVMLEEDYLKSSQLSAVSSQPPEPNYQPLTSNYNFSDPRLKELNEYSTQLIKELVIPKLTHQINTSKRYAPLRQVYYSLILAQWFKQKYKGRFSESSNLFGRTVPDIDSGNLANLTSIQPYDKQTYFKQYQKSFAEGEYNLQEPVYTPMGQSIRKYMSGGISIVSSPVSIQTFRDKIPQAPYLLEVNNNIGNFPEIQADRTVSSALSGNNKNLIQLINDFIVKEYVAIWESKKSKKDILKELSSGETTIKDMIFPILGSYYRKLRMAINVYEPLVKRGIIKHDYEISKTTEKENLAIQVREEYGWHHRLPKNRRQRGWSTSKDKAMWIISLNVIADRQLIEKLDKFIVEEIKGYYKTPDTEERWLERHDTVTMYLYEEITPYIEQRIKEIAAPFIRSKEDVLIGEKIADGIFKAEKPTQEQMEHLIGQIEEIYPEVAKKVALYVNDWSGKEKYKFSLGQFWAVKRFTKTLLEESKNVKLLRKKYMGRINNFSENNLESYFIGDMGIWIMAGDFSYKVWIENKSKTISFQRYDYDKKNPLGAKREIPFNVKFQVGKEQNIGNNYIMPDEKLSGKHFEIEIFVKDRYYNFNINNLDPMNSTIVEWNVTSSPAETPSASSAVEWVEKVPQSSSIEDLFKSIGFVAKFPIKIFLFINPKIEIPKANFINWEFSKILHEAFKVDAKQGEGLIQLPESFLSLAEVDQKAILLSELIRLFYPATSYGEEFTEKLFEQEKTDEIRKMLINSFWNRWAVRRLIKDGYLNEAKEYANYLIKKYRNDYKKAKNNIQQAGELKLKQIVVFDFLIAYNICVLPFKLENYLNVAKEYVSEINNIFNNYLTEDAYNKIISLVESLILKDEVYPNIFDFEKLEKEILQVSNSASPLLVEQKNSGGDIAASLPSPQIHREDNLGGIAFNALPIRTEPVTSSALGSFPGVKAFQGNLDAEWAQIQQVFNAGIRPSIQRLSEYTQAASASPLAGEKIDEVRGLLADILRRDEDDEKLLVLSSALKELLAFVEFDNPAGELNRVTVPRANKI